MVTGLYALLCSALFLLQATSAVETLCVNKVGNRSELEGTYQHQFMDSWGIKVYATTDCYWCNYGSTFYYRVYGYGTYGFAWFLSGTLDDSYTYLYCYVVGPIEYLSPIRATECTTDNPNAVWFTYDYDVPGWVVNPVVDIEMCETGAPSTLPSTGPTAKPTKRTGVPTDSPTTLTSSPTEVPSTSEPSYSPSRLTRSPTNSPVVIPSAPPSSYPTPGPVTKAPTQNRQARLEAADTTSGQAGGIAAAIIIPIVIILIAIGVGIWWFKVKKPERERQLIDEAGGPGDQVA